MKYKLIKEYPGSWEIGTIVEFEKNSDRCLINGVTSSITAMQVLNYPEFWQKIEKDYEILSLNIHDTIISSMIGHNDEYIEALLKDKLIKIHSIKRLSDNKIFTVNDNIKWKGNVYTINSIHINNDDIVYFKLKETIEQPALSMIDEYLKQTFITEDKASVFLWDEIFAVRPDFTIWNCKVSTIIKSNYYNKEYKMFSTKKAAEEYIIMNKPCLSIKDIINNYEKDGLLNFITFSDKFQKLIKTKLNL